MLNTRNTIIAIFCLTTLLGCNKSKNETYMEKIERFETNSAIDQVIEAEEIVRQGNNVLIPDFYYVNFSHFPVPTHFKNSHASLGVDTSKISYRDEQWLQDIRQMDQAAQAAPVTIQSHHH